MPAGALARVPPPSPLARASGTALGPLQADPAVVGRVLDVMLRTPSENTRRAYQADLGAFAAWAEQPQELAIAHLIQLGPLEGHACVLQWRDALAATASPATVNRRLSSLRKLLAVAATLGVSSWQLSLPGVRVEAYRDTRGPGVDAIQEVILQADREGTLRGRRDALVLRLLFTLGLRRGEVSSLDLGHVELGPPARLWVLGKGRQERIPLTLPSSLQGYLGAWVNTRRQQGARPTSPLFVLLGRRPTNPRTSAPPEKRPEKRLSGGMIWHVATQRGNAIGVRVRPHGVRHSAVTAVLDANGGDVRAAQKFSRHKRVDTVLIYDDTRRDLAGQAAAGLDDLLKK